MDRLVFYKEQACNTTDLRFHNLKNHWNLLFNLQNECYTTIVKKDSNSIYAWIFLHKI